MNHIKIYIILLVIGATIAIGTGIYIIKKKNKLKELTGFLVKALDVYAKNVLNKVKLVILLNTLRAYVLDNTKNRVALFFIKLLWPEIDLVKTALNVQNANSTSEVIKSIPDVIVSKTVDRILNDTKYTSDFATTTNLKITEKDRGYLEAYLEGQVNKLEEARIGIKGGIKF